MSRVEIMQTITKGIIIAGVGLELNRNAFNVATRNSVLVRDHCICQFGGCQSSNNLSVHHIIPESCFNGKRSGNNNGDIYTAQVTSFLEEQLLKIDPKKLKRLKSKARRFIHSPENGIVLCQDCHTGLHRDSISVDQLSLLTNQNHLHRTQALTLPSIQTYIISLIQELG